MVIQPDDTWDLVVAKAIHCMMGHQDEAIAAFTKYGDMFAETTADNMHQTPASSPSIWPVVQASLTGPSTFTPWKADSSAQRPPATRYSDKTLNQHPMHNI
ncbi:MAG: hypothetical protein R2911_21645 [Caldilineaceae bacterium]